MNETPRQKLAQLVALYGPDVVDDPRRCEGLMRDLLGADQYRREVNLLVAALKERVPADLRASSGTPPAILLARLAQRLHDNQGIREDYALWAVEAWAQALGVETGEGRGGGEEGREERRGKTVVGGAAVAGGPAVVGGPAPLGGRVTLTVAADGSGDYLALVDAVHAAPPGAMVQVQPGLYRESLTLDKPLDIVAAGGAGDVIIRSVGPCLSVRAEPVTARGLALSREDDAEGAAVEVERGKLRLADCWISSLSRACVVVNGPRAALEAQGCRIVDGAEIGVWFRDRAQGELTDCDIIGHARNGVQISESSDPLLRQCRVRENGEVGAQVDTYGLGRFEHCEISDNQFHGVLITEAAKPTLTHCQINRNEFGIWVMNGGRAEVFHCDLRGNRQGGWKLGVGSYVIRSANQE